MTAESELTVERNLPVRILNTRRPEGLVYRVNAEGQKALLGAVFWVPPGEEAPSPGGPLITWHSHEEDKCPAFHPTPDDPCEEAVRLLHVWTADGVVDPFADSFARAMARRGTAQPFAPATADSAARAD